MEGKKIYPLVYEIVKRAQKENPNLKNFVKYYEWSKRIPKPQVITDELADAICTSVSSSQGVGLEIYYFEKVYIKDLEYTFMDNQLTHLLSNINSDGKKFGFLGDIIRNGFDGRKVPNEKDKELLISL
jgi:hypothetical protein